METDDGTAQVNSTAVRDDKRAPSSKHSDAECSGLINFSEALVRHQPKGQAVLRLLKGAQPSQHGMDFIIISEENALSKSGVVVSDSEAVLNSLSRITDAIPNARILQFEVKKILTENDSITMHTEAERLLYGLMLLRANDVHKQKDQPGSSMEPLSSENHRMVFIAKNIGTVLVKECLMRSRVSDEDVRSSIWKDCRGTVFVDPFDAATVAKLRKGIPQGYFAELGAKWRLPALVRGQELSMALDEVQAIEAAYARISQDVPPRFSISTVSSSGLGTKVNDWKGLSDPGLRPQLDALRNILKDVWSKAAPNPPIPLAASIRPGASLLSLDGGGIKGVSGLMILEAIMKKVWKIENPQAEYPNEGTKVQQYFQLAAGTSTGGLAAVMLFRLRMYVPEAIKAYKDFAEAIFEPKIFGWPFKKLGGPGLALGNFWLKLKMVFNQARYDPAALEAKTKEIVATHPPGSNGAEVKLLDPQRLPEEGKMFMCATRTDLREVAILRSYSSSDDVEDGPPEESDAKESNEVYKKQHPTVKAAIGFEDITIWEAARATSAAPTYFPEMKFKGVTFWDGGLLNNNPIDQLWDARFDAEMQVKCILSLGASRPTRTVLGPFALVNKIKQITGFLTDCEPKHKDFERMIRRMNTRLPDYEQIQYFRLNASTENESIDLSDYRKIGDLERYTNNYLDTFEAQETILRCAWMLAKGHTQNPA